MQAAFVTDLCKVEIREVDMPVIAANEVLIKTKVVGICGSDLHLYRGTHPFRHAPAILGHETAGEIVAIGSDVTRFKIGDRVTVEPQVGCGECEMCKQGYISLCKNKKVPGTSKWVGAFSEFFPAHEKTVYRLDDSTPYERGCLAEPLAVAVHALSQTNADRGTIVILGGGTIGQFLTVLAHLDGYEQIIVTDPVKFNRDFAVACGATTAIDPLTEDVPAVVKERTGGRGADLVIVAAAARGILDQACECVRKRGQLCLVAMLVEPDLFYAYSIVLNELNVFGAMCYTAQDFAKAVALINGHPELGKLVTQVLDGIEKTPYGLHILSDKAENCVKVLVRI